MSDMTADKVQEYICSKNIEYHDNIFVDAIETYKEEVLCKNIGGVNGGTHCVFYMFKDSSVIGIFPNRAIVAKPEMVLKGYMDLAIMVSEKEEGIQRVSHDA